MAIAVTPNLLRDLATFRASNRCALSLYLDLDPSVTATTPDVEAKFRARLNEAEKQTEERAAEHDCRAAVREDMERIQAWWANDFDRDGVHGLGLFASGADGYFLALPLSSSVPDATYIGEELLLSPLVGRFSDVDTLVAVVSREQGRIYRLRNDRLVEIVDESEEQPGQHDQGGWSQARYQRHIDHLVQQHLKSVGAALQKRARVSGRLQLVVLCPEEMRSNFASTLTQEARDSIAGWANAEAHATPAELREIVRPLLDEAEARRQQDALDRFAEGLGRGDRAVAGWQPTLDAAADTRVDTLFLTEGANRTLYQCPECRRGYVEDGTCPIDDLALVAREDGDDVAVRHVLANGGTVTRVGAGALGDEVIGALLRF
jgi:peptide chain release factor subunit 1